MLSMILKVYAQYLLQKNSILKLLCMSHLQYQGIMIIFYLDYSPLLFLFQRRVCPQLTTESSQLAVK